jgi:ABC-type branched-subunit amino acid transport system permease subunit
VTVSPEWNLFIVGALLVLFVTAAPDGIMGLARRRSRANGGRR